MATVNPNSSASATRQPSYTQQAQLVSRQVPLAEGAPEQYVVKEGDTLWDIARSFGISVNDLCAANDLGRRQLIRPGQRLILPVGVAYGSDLEKTKSKQESRLQDGLEKS